MPFRLEKVTDESDFNELTSCQCESFRSPPQPFLNIFVPAHGPAPNGQARLDREFASRQSEWHRSNPASYWQKIVDSDSGELVGGALWHINESNPFESHGEPLVLDWYPEGNQRDFMTQAHVQFVTPRMKMIPRPHVYLNILFTHPDHRRQGAGDLAMNWGIKKADELGVEMWVDASSSGLPLYRKYGFIVVHETVLEPKTEHPDDEWNGIKDDFGRVAVNNLWRPAYGKLREGQAIPQFPG